MMTWLVFLALLLQGFVPAGFMPQFGQGRIAMTICSGTGDKIIYVDEEGAQGHGSGQAGDACPYFLAQAGGTWPEPILSLQPLALYEPVLPVWIDRSADQQSLHFLPPPRGPPRPSVS